MAAVEGDLEFTGRAALVSGVDGRAGRAIALELAARGAAVLLHGVDTATVGAVAVEVAALGARTHVAHGSLDVPGAIEDLSRRAEEFVRRVDILVVCSAGDAGAAEPLARVLAPRMMEAGRGRIVLVCERPAGADADRDGSVADVIAALVPDFGEFGITVNAIHAHGPGDAGAAAIDRLPMRRAPGPDEVAFACAFLCSRRSAAITGASILVDGGAALI